MLSHSLIYTLGFILVRDTINGLNLNLNPILILNFAPNIINCDIFICSIFILHKLGDIFFYHRIQ